MGAASSRTPDKGRYQPDRPAPAHPPVVDDWLTEHESSPETHRAYVADMRLWTAWCSRGGVDPIGASRADCQRFRTWLAATPSDVTGRPRAKTSQARVLAAVASLYYYMEQEEMIQRSPLAHVKRPKAKAVGTKALSEDETRLFLAAAKAYGHREYVAAKVMLGIGVRAAGLLAIDIEDLVIDDARLFAHITLKGQSRDLLPFPEDTADAVDSLRGDRTTGPLFVGRRGTWGYDALQAAMVAVGERAGIATRTTPHVLRATWATTALSHDVSPEYVRAVMGHSKIETTLGYDRRREDMARKIKAVDAVAKALMGEAPPPARGDASDQP